MGTQYLSVQETDESWRIAKARSENAKIYSAPGLRDKWISIKCFINICIKS